MASKGIRHGDFLLQSDFLEVLDFISHYHRPDSETQKLINRKALFDQEHLSYVGSLVQIRGIPHMRVEIHIGPACIKSLRVHILSPLRVKRDGDSPLPLPGLSGTL